MLQCALVSAHVVGIFVHQVSDTYGSLVPCQHHTIAALNAATTLTSVREAILMSKFFKGHAMVMLEPRRLQCRPQEGRDFETQ